MTPRIPRWLIITLVALALVIFVGGTIWAFNARIYWLGWLLVGLFVLIVAIFAAVIAPPLIRLYRFNKYYKQHGAQLALLGNLMQSGRIQEALMRFEGVMKHAPDNAYMFYMRALFLQAAGKLPEAMTAATKALSLAAKDPLLPVILQQSGGQMGQPTTVEGFRAQLESLRDSLSPRVSQMRERREKAAARRKKKSR